MIASDSERTQYRIRELHAYMEANVLGSDFCCRFAEGCRTSIRPGDRFYEGILSHVGRHFDLKVGGKEMRVVIVGQEPGHRPRPMFKAEYNEFLRSNAESARDANDVDKRHVALTSFHRAQIRPVHSCRLR